MRLTTAGRFQRKMRCAGVMASAIRMKRMVQVPVKWVASSKGSGISAPERQRHSSQSAGTIVPARTSVLSGENRPVRSVHGVTRLPTSISRVPSQVAQTRRDGNRNRRSHLITSVWAAKRNRTLAEGIGLPAADAKKLRLDLL